MKNSFHLPDRQKIFQNKKTWNPCSLFLPDFSPMTSSAIANSACPCPILRRPSLTSTIPHKHISNSSLKTTRIQQVAATRIWTHLLQIRIVDFFYMKPLFGTVVFVDKLGFGCERFSTSETVNSWNEMGDLSVTLKS